MTTLDVNGVKREVEADDDTPLLWVLRDDLGLTGTKYGCGVAQCGACTVHVDGVARRACVLPLSSAVGKKITTIEGVAAAGAPALSKAVQKAWIENEVAQCGYCQPGQIMSAISLLTKTPAPTDAQIEAGITNICRCATYDRIRAAVRAAAKGA